ncbi:MAG TPA: hypothetical protein VD886_08520 [Herpetosiphonaceae bacterium]|nr:hypothetical protein [Herpetosiphonaceae bacterium]
MQAFLSLVQRLIWPLWVVGIVLVLLDWNGTVSPVAGWAGVGLVMASFLASVGLRLYWRYRGPLDPAALRHPWAALLPGAAAVPPELQLAQQGFITNDMIVARSKDPGKRALLEEWGRTGSIFRYYQNPRARRARLGLVELNLQLIHFDQIAGARKMLHTPDPEHTARFSHYQLQPGPPELGDESTLGRFLIAAGMTTILEGIEVIFHREQFLCGVVLSVLQGTMEARELEALVVGLGAEIDRRLLAAAVVAA